MVASRKVTSKLQFASERAPNRQKKKRRPVILFRVTAVRDSDGPASQCTMASLLAPVYRCYYCEFESTDSSFKYFDNKKVDQPRHQCHNCHKLFTLGSHGRPQGKTYAKKRNEDPAELKSLSRQCRHCGVADNALFKYYNNNNRLQPRFKCLSCGKQFQMRLMGTGEEMRLVHTSCNQRHATGRCKKPGVLEAFTNAASNFGEESYHPSDGSFMPMTFDPLMPVEPGARLLPDYSEEDVQYASLLEAELTDENESPNVDPISYNANVDDGLLPELSAEDAECLALLESESLTDETEQALNAQDPISRAFGVDYGFPPTLCAENAEYVGFLEAGLTDENEASNADTFSSTANVDDELLPWSDNASELMDFESIEAVGRADESDDAEMVQENMVDMDSDCTSNAAVVSGTLSVETLAPSESESWSSNTIEDPSSLNYLDAALACCQLMDMAHSMPVAPVQVVETPAPTESDSWSSDTIEDPTSLNYLDAALACCQLMDMRIPCPSVQVELCESSSSSAGSTISFGDSSCDTSEPFSFQQYLMEEDQSSIGDWNDWNERHEEEDDIEMTPWSSYPRQT